MGIVESAPFQMRIRLEPADTVNNVAQARTHDRHQEASVPPNVPPRYFRRHDGAAAAGRDGAGAAAESRTAANAPFRFGAVYMPNGVYPDTWHPEVVGSGFQFKPVMQPLESRSGASNRR